MLQFFYRSGLEQISSSRKDVTPEQAKLDALILRWREWYERFYSQPRPAWCAGELEKLADYLMVFTLKKRRDSADAR